MLDTYVENSKDEIIKNTQNLIKIPSIDSPCINKLHPFGENCNEALEYMLKLGSSLGFRTKNIDGYCGYIEFGKGDELVGILGHLDVVPVDNNWTYPPFCGKIFNNVIYGRGAIDDKGPVISCLYAMKAVMDNYDVSKRVRLILGLNEEKDWRCIEYYKLHEEIPTIGFSPDADFPCIYAEKAVLNCELTFPYFNSDKKIIIENIDCDNNPLNVVPKYCSVIVNINSNKIFMNEFIGIIKNFINLYGFEIDIYKIDETHLKLTSYGISAHSAHPDLGKNAISPLIIVLSDIFNFYNINIDLFDFFKFYIGNDFDGKNLGINFSDESGILTLNVGNFKIHNNLLKIGLNLRIPINTSIKKICDIILKSLSLYSNINLNVLSSKDALYLPKDNKLVKTLCEIYNNTTNSNAKPIAIGGLTYARAFKNCISFGANFPGNKDMCHQADEFISIDNLILSCKIYANAIYELSK